MPSRKVLLHDICDVLVELCFDKSSVVPRQTKLLYSSEILDMYIDSMLEKKRRMNELIDGNRLVHRSLLHLIEEFLTWHENIYFFEDSHGILCAGDIPFMHEL